MIGFFVLLKGMFICRTRNSSWSSVTIFLAASSTHLPPTLLLCVTSVKKALEHYAVSSPQCLAGPRAAEMRWHDTGAALKLPLHKHHLAEVWIKSSSRLNGVSLHEQGHVSSVQQPTLSWPYRPVVKPGYHETPKKVNFYLHTIFSELAKFDGNGNFPFNLHRLLKKNPAPQS